MLIARVIVEDLDDSNKDIDLKDGLLLNKVDEKDDAWLHALVDSGSKNEADFETFKRNDSGMIFRFGSSQDLNC